MFHSVTQDGPGAVKLTKVYSQFKTAAGVALVRPPRVWLTACGCVVVRFVCLFTDAWCGAQSLPQLEESLPDVGSSMISLLLELLVTRRLLRPFIAAGEMFWRIPPQ